MSEKYSAELEGILEGIREEIGIYSNEFEKTKSKSNELRFYFSVVGYYETLSKEDNSEDSKILYEKARENYNRLFTEEDVFSPNRKA